IIGEGEADHVLWLDERDLQVTAALRERIFAWERAQPNPPVSNIDYISMERYPVCRLPIDGTKRQIIKISTVGKEKGGHEERGQNNHSRNRRQASRTFEHLLASP